jgi:integrase
VASVQKRRGQWAVVWRDGTRAQRARFFGTGNDAREAADAYLAKVIPQARQKRQPVVDPKITIATYGQRWLDQVEALVQAGERKPRTLEHYDDMLRLHIEPQLGTIPVRELGRGDVKELLLTKLRSGLDASTVNIIYRTLRAMLSAAVDDEVIPANPIAKLGRALGLSPSKAARQEAVKSKAMTRAQLITFLSTVFTRERRWYPLLLTLARTGLRLGEGLAIQIGLHDDGDLDFLNREITVARTLSDNGRRVDTPKTGESRIVDMSQQLAETLRAQAVAVRAAALKVGVPTEQRLWLFPERTGGPRDPHNVRRAFARILKHATLPAHLTPHCLRHTFASILLAEGKSPAYVQAQLGHKSIAMTVDTYGRWLPKGNKAAIDSLDDPCTAGTPEVGGGDFGGDFGPAATKSDAAVGIVPQDFRELITNGPCWTRTNDPLLKRQLL